MSSNSLVREWERSSVDSFAAMLPNCDTSIDEEFASLISAALRQPAVNINDITSEFEVNRSTVHRWANGKTKPHVLVRPLIVDFIIKKLKDFSSLKEEIRKNNYQLEQKNSLKAG